MLCSSLQYGHALLQDHRNTNDNHILYPTPILPRCILLQLNPMCLPIESMTWLIASMAAETGNSWH
jgi:hypothetical protein